MGDVNESDLEQRLADALLEVDRLERMVANLELQANELRREIQRISNRPTTAPAMWSREQDFTGEA